MDKFLYFRTVAAADDDALTGDSVCFHRSKLVGITPKSATSIQLQFETLQGDSSEDSDFVILNITEDKQKEAIEDIVNVVLNGKSGFTVIGDDATSDYASSHITSVGAVTIAAAD